MRLTLAQEQVKLRLRLRMGAEGDETLPRPKPTAEDLKERKALAKTFKVFRREFKITQRALADLMREPGDDSAAGCRRTIQMIEAGKITPHKSTLTRFSIVKNRIESENI